MPNANYGFVRPRPVPHGYSGPYGSASLAARVRTDERRNCGTWLSQRPMCAWIHVLIAAVSVASVQPPPIPCGSRSVDALSIGERLYASPQYCVYNREAGSNYRSLLNGRLRSAKYASVAQHVPIRMQGSPR